jgi:hypothetical protein
MTSGWVTNLRSILELAFFTSNIVIAVAVVYGLKQIRLAKQIATSDARRESIRFAAERCQYYAEKCVALHAHVGREHERLGLTFLKTKLQFSIVDGEIKPKPFDENALTQQFQKMNIDIVALLNSVEAFAIPFAAGVADEEVGFQETAVAYCALVEQQIGMVFLLRYRVGTRFESLVKVYDRWKSRLVAQDLEGKMKQMQEQHKAAAQKGKIKSADPF